MVPSERYVILDTNFLMIGEEFKLDLFSELDRLLDFRYKLVTLKPVVRELEKVAEGKGKKGISAKVGLKLLNRVKIVDTKIKDPDQAILEFALQKNAIVCTNDKELKKKLIRQGINIIYLKGKTHLELK